MGVYKRITLDELKQMALRAKDCIDRIYIHWTAGNYQQYFSDYHLLIDYDGKIVSTTDDLTEKKEHTWKRNSNAIGIAMCCCVGATCQADGSVDYGSQPPTAAMIDSTAQVVACLCDALGLAININNVMTHAEIADRMPDPDKYGPETTCERWDLWFLPDIPGDGQLKPGGDVIRGKAEWWRINGLND